MLRSADPALPRVGESCAQALAARYRAWDANGRRGMDPLEARDADAECRHGRLPGDRTQPCGCFTEPTTRRDDMLTNELSSNGAAAPAAAVDDEAPYGRRADGSPRAKPGPRGGRRKPAEPKAAPAVTAGPAVPASFLAQMVATLDAEIERLQQARERLVELA